MNYKAKTHSEDSGFINTGENYEVEYWSKKFDVTPEVLKSAVKSVGNAVEAVRTKLNK